MTVANQNLLIYVVIKFAIVTEKFKKSPSTATVERH